MSVDTESFTIMLSLSCTTSHPWVSLNASRADQCGAGWNWTKGLTSAHRTSHGDTPSAHRSRYLLTPTHTNTDTTQKNSPLPLSPPPCIYTLKGIFCRDIIFVSLSRPLSFLVLSPPRPLPRWPLYPCLSRIRNTHTYLSRPCQIHQLHIHTCYITYPIDLKSPLFMFISHATFLLNKTTPSVA